MDVNRRHLMGVSAAGVAGALAMSPDAARAAPPTSSLGRDATQYGVRPGSPDDQTRALQRAIDEAARAQAPLALPPGVYRTGMLRLQNGTQLVGVRGATKLVFSGGASLLQGEGAGSIGLSNITLDGGGIPLPTRRGLVHCLSGRDIRITDCEITGSGGNGIWFENCSGDISGNIISKIAVTGITSFDAQGLLVSRNTIIDTNDNGIEILRHVIGDDGTLVLDNRIEDIKAGPGGSGQYGNAINAFRAGNVIVRGNRIRNCDYSAVRGNSASNIQIQATASPAFARWRCIPNSRSRARSSPTTPSMAPHWASPSAISTKADASRSCRATSFATCCRSARSAPRRTTTPASASMSRPIRR